MKLLEIWPGVDPKERRRILRCFPKFNTLFIVKDELGNILDWDADHFGLTIPDYLLHHAPKEWDIIEPYAWLPGGNFIPLPFPPLKKIAVLGVMQETASRIPGEIRRIIQGE